MRIECIYAHEVLRTEPGKLQESISCHYDYVPFPFKWPPLFFLCPSADTIFIPVVLYLHVFERYQNFRPLIFAWRTLIHLSKLILDVSFCRRSFWIGTPSSSSGLPWQPVHTSLSQHLKHCGLVSVCLSVSIRTVRTRAQLDPLCLPCLAHCLLHSSCSVQDWSN